jgi:hypothetical protein
MKWSLATVSMHTVLKHAGSSPADMQPTSVENSRTPCWGNCSLIAAAVQSR